MSFTCVTCKYWNNSEDIREYSDTGKCMFLSGERNVFVKEHDGWTRFDDKMPDLEITGLQGTPICTHDGIAIDFETKGWFGCIHHKIIG